MKMEAQIVKMDKMLKSGFIPKEFEIECCGTLAKDGFRVIQIERLWGHQFISKASGEGITYRQAEKIKRLKEKHAAKDWRNHQQKKVRLS